MLRHLRPILLVEDNDLDAELTIDALKEAKLTNPIIRIEDGVEALEYLTDAKHFSENPQNHPLFVLLDLHMTRMHGHELLQLMRADRRLEHLPVIILASSRDDRDRAMAWDLGVNGYVLKPLDRDEFLVAVRTIGAFWALVNEPPPLANI